MYFQIWLEFAKSFRQGEGVSVKEILLEINKPFKNMLDYL